MFFYYSEDALILNESYVECDDKAVLLKAHVCVYCGVCICCSCLRRVQINKRLHIVTRQLSIGSKESTSKAFGSGYTRVHCPKILSAVGRLKHSTSHSFSPPATTIFPPMKAAACDFLGLGSGATKLQRSLAISFAASTLDALSISTVSVILSGPVWPPMANKRPSSAHATPKPDLCCCIFGNKLHLKVKPW